MEANARACALHLPGYGADTTREFGIGQARRTRMAVSNDELIRTHYREVAQKHGASPRSSMEDDFVREKELEWIVDFYRVVSKEAQHSLRVLEVGCGNGYALNMLSRLDGADQFLGIDFSEDLLSIASARQLSNCLFKAGDVRALDLESEVFDWVYTERCLINVLSWKEQEAALREIARVLKRGAYYLMIEAFTDGLYNNNKARLECGLPEIEQAYHNNYFDKDLFLQAIDDLYTIVEASRLDKFPMASNFLSSHYFVSRVLCPALTKGEVVRNSEVAKFFSFLAPMGNYSPIQAYILKKK
jgi:ubiquinone/menaquinone biosynthesis C-methylase UbiE